MTSAAFNSSSLTPKFRWSRQRSHESLQSLEHGRRNSDNVVSEALPAMKQCLVRPIDQSRAQQVSRLELLLLAKSEKPIFLPEEDTTNCHKVNKAIKACTQWSDVQDIITANPKLSSSNLAFALYRLGCLSAFASKKRVADLKASSFVPKIFSQAMKQIELMEPSSLVLLLDGCARMQHRPTDDEMSKIASLIQQNVYSLYARQLPLVLWAFTSLQFTPRSDVLLGIEDAVNRQAPELSSQGMALVLSSFHTAKHRLNELTLHRLAEVIQRKALLFKPSELATCLKALSAQGYKASSTFLEAISDRSGHFNDRNALAFGDSTYQKPNLANLR